MSSLINITFIASPTSNPAPRTIVADEDYTIGEYLTEVEQVSNLKNLNVEVDGASADLSTELEDGMTIAISQKKTDSGC